MCFSNIDITLFNNLSRPLDLSNIDSSLWSDKCDYIDRSKHVNLNLDNYNLIVLQLNVRSILNKQLEIKQLLLDLGKKKLQSRYNALM